MSLKNNIQGQKDSRLEDANSVDGILRISPMDNNPHKPLRGLTELISKEKITDRIVQIRLAGGSIPASWITGPDTSLLNNPDYGDTIIPYEFLRMFFTCPSTAWIDMKITKVPILVISGEITKFTSFSTQEYVIEGILLNGAKYEDIVIDASIIVYSHILAGETFKLNGRDYTEGVTPGFTATGNILTDAIMLAGLDYSDDPSFVSATVIGNGDRVVFHFCDNPAFEINPRSKCLLLGDAINNVKWSFYMQTEIDSRSPASLLASDITSSSCTFSWEDATQDKGALMHQVKWRMWDDLGTESPWTFSDIGGWIFDAKVKLEGSRWPAATQTYLGKYAYWMEFSEPDLLDGKKPGGWVEIIDGNFADVMITSYGSGYVYQPSIKYYFKELSNHVVIDPVWSRPAAANFIRIHEDAHNFEVGDKVIVKSKIEEFTGTFNVIDVGQNIVESTITFTGIADGTGEVTIGGVTYTNLDNLGTTAADVSAELFAQMTLGPNDPLILSFVDNIGSVEISATHGLQLTYVANTGIAGAWTATPFTSYDTFDLDIPDYSNFPDNALARQFMGKLELAPVDIPRVAGEIIPVLSRDKYYIQNLSTKSNYEVAVVSYFSLDRKDFCEYSMNTNFRTR
jgi:hypothetical protein